MTVNSPLNAMGAFSEASVCLKYNIAVGGLQPYQDGPKGRFCNPTHVVIGSLADLGFTRFINLARRNVDSSVALAFYAGDGLVAKVMPKGYYQIQSDKRVLSVPSICSFDIDADGRDFVIGFYPYIPQGYVCQNDVNDLAKTLGALGQVFANGDQYPRNVHRLPDAGGTLVGIDSGMFEGAESSPELLDAWSNYVSELYPIYQTGMVPPQTKDTDFNFVSLHDPNTNLVTFDLKQDDPVVRSPAKTKKIFFISRLWGGHRLG